MEKGVCVFCEQEKELFENPYTEKEDTCQYCLEDQDKELI